MYNFITLSFAKKVSITLFLLLVCAYQTVQAQTPHNSLCFTITVAATTNTACEQNLCDPDQGQCSHCYEVTITNTGCTGLTINTLTMTTPGDQIGDCRSICSPSGDFLVYTSTETPMTRCSWAGPRYLTYLGNGGNGLPPNGTAKFIICRKQPLTPPGTTPLRYKFSCGCNCGGSPCDDGWIDF